jgi:AcrR family transcriptional regulator
MPARPAPTRERLLDAALELLGTQGASACTGRTVERTAGVPHGSVRHHFGDHHGLLLALPDHLAARETASGQPRELAAAVADWLGPGRTVALARYELFLLAARDEELRARVVAVRDQLVAQVAVVAGEARAPAVLAQLDGLILDALLRGASDPAPILQEAGRLMMR